ncbi:putative ribonuclease H [Pseudomonas phage pPa_SNUABM_DT01]|nr:putative ribonuclease H [Pseudomonas phage pPa_SNUABM_DT01]
MTEVNKDNPTGVAYHGVLYADGGFYSSERAGGWGLHGYVYSAESLPDKAKGSGVPGSTPTAKGYSDTKDETKAVNVLNYIDSFGGVPKASSNNHTELLAAKEALTYVLEKGLHQTTIYSDSEYVVKGVNQYLDRWKQTGWRNRNGDEVSNKSDWLAVDSLLTQLRDNQNQVTLAWIKGHNGHTGNEKADSWAGKGNCIGLNGYDLSFKLEQPPEGYWKSVSNYNRMLDQPKWYFSSDAKECRLSKDGRHVYWTGQHGDDEDVAKPQSDSSNAVLYLKEQLPVLEKVREHFVEKDHHQVGHLFVGALRNLLNANVAEDIHRFGLKVFKGNKANWSLQTEKKVPVVHHVTPTGLSFYNVDNLTNMTVILDQFMEGDKSVLVTDLTDLLYEAVEKKAVTTRKLRKEIANTVKHLDVSVGYNTAFARELRAMEDVPRKVAKVRLIVGSDIIGRNALAALAETVKRVVVLTWRESDTVIRYATVIETEHDIGIWANPFGNFKLVN